MGNYLHDSTTLLQAEIRSLRIQKRKDRTDLSERAKGMTHVKKEEEIPTQQTEKENKREKDRIKDVWGRSGMWRTRRKDATPGSGPRVRHTRYPPARGPGDLNSHIIVYWTN